MTVNGVDEDPVSLSNHSKTTAEISNAGKLDASDSQRCCASETHTQSTETEGDNEPSEAFESTSPAAWSEEQSIEDSMISVEINALIEMVTTEHAGIKLRDSTSSNSGNTLLQNSNAMSGREIGHTKDPRHERSSSLSSVAANGDQTNRQSMNKLSRFSCQQNFKGRVRSRTIELRRRGVDIGAAELKISSKWSSSEQDIMADFRAAIWEKARNQKPGESVMGIWTSKRGKAWVNEAKALRRRVSKGLQKDRKRTPAATTSGDCVGSDTAWQRLSISFIADIQASTPLLHSGFPIRTTSLAVQSNEIDQPMTG